MTLVYSIDTVVNEESACNYVVSFIGINKALTTAVIYEDSQTKQAQHYLLIGTLKKHKGSL